MDDIYNMYNTEEMEKDILSFACFKVLGVANMGKGLGGGAGICLIESLHSMTELQRFAPLSISRRSG